MKCPYNITLELVSQDTYTHEDGNVTFHQQKLIEKHEFTDCLQEECAAWDGRCRYNERG